MPLRRSASNQATRQPNRAGALLECINPWGRRIAARFAYTEISLRPVSLKNSSSEMTDVTVSTVE